MVGLALGLTFELRRIGADQCAQDYAVVWADDEQRELAAARVIGPFALENVRDAEGCAGRDVSRPHRQKKRAAQPMRLHCSLSPCGEPLRRYLRAGAGACEGLAPGPPGLPFLSPA